MSRHPLSIMAILSFLKSSSTGHNSDSSDDAYNASGTDYEHKASIYDGTRGLNTGDDDDDSSLKQDGMNTAGSSRFERIVD